MASKRRRMVSAEIWENKKLVSIDYIGRLLFIGLITYGNDFGKEKGDSPLLKSKIFPYEEKEDVIKTLEKMLKKFKEKSWNEIIDEYLDELSKGGNDAQLQYYKVGLEKFIKLLHWKDHQTLTYIGEDDIPNPGGQMDIGFNKDDIETKDTLIKTIKDLFDYWNSKKVVIHEVLTDKMSSKIKSALKNYKIDKVKESIDNYATIMKDKAGKYYWTHKWTLIDFLSRGLERFLNSADPLNNFLSNKRGTKLQQRITNITHSKSEVTATNGVGEVRKDKHGRVIRRNK